MDINEFVRARLSEEETLAHLMTREDCRSDPAIRQTIRALKERGVRLRGEPADAAYTLEWCRTGWRMLAGSPGDRVLRDMASRWAGHPDYAADWRSTLGVREALGTQNASG